MPRSLPQPPAGGLDRPQPEPRPVQTGKDAGFRAARLLAPLLPVLAVLLWLAATFRVVMGLLLVFHALVHTGFVSPEPERKPGAPPWPFHLDRSWLLSNLCRGSRVSTRIGTGLVAVTVAGSAAAAAGLLAGQGWWTGPAAGSAAASLVLLGLYVHPMLVLGFVVDAFILSVILLRWPAPGYLG